MNTKQLNKSITKVRASLEGKIAIRETWKQEAPDYPRVKKDRTGILRYLNALNRRIKGLKETLRAKEALQ
jgi:hypothetical protein